MNTDHYRVPHVLRGKKDEHGCFTNEGFHLVSHGVVELDEAEMRIYDGDAYDYVTAPTPSMTFKLSTIVTAKFASFRSKRGHYRGGVIRIDGVFDRAVDERLTLKMPADEYCKLRLRLKEILEGL